MKILDQKKCLFVSWVKEKDIVSDLENVKKKDITSEKVSYIFTFYQFGVAKIF